MFTIKLKRIGFQVSLFTQGFQYLLKNPTFIISFENEIKKLHYSKALQNYCRNQ